MIIFLLKSWLCGLKRKIVEERENPIKHLHANYTSDIPDVRIAIPNFHKFGCGTKMGRKSYTCRLNKQYWIFTNMSIEIKSYLNCHLYIIFFISTETHNRRQEVYPKKKIEKSKCKFYMSLQLFKWVPVIMNQKFYFIVMH